MSNCEVHGVEFSRAKPVAKARAAGSALLRRAAQLLLVLSTLALGGCEDPQVYGSVGVSSGYGGYYGGYGGWSQPRMHTSISIGGRIR